MRRSQYAQNRISIKEAEALIVMLLWIFGFLSVNKFLHHIIGLNKTEQSNKYINLEQHQENYSDKKKN